MPDRSTTEVITKKGTYHGDPRPWDRYDELAHDLRSIDRKLHNGQIDETSAAVSFHLALEVAETVRETEGPIFG